MESLAVLKIFHVAATVVLLGSVAVVIYRAWRSWKGGDRLPFASTLQRPWVYAWLVMALSLVSFPVTGWWLVHRVGWPLGQTWILTAAVLYVIGGGVWLLLINRVNRLRFATGLNEGVIAAKRRNVLIIAAVAVVVLLSIIGLMVTKPA